MNTLSPGYEPKNITVVLQEGWLWHYMAHEGWYVIKETKQNYTQGSLNRFPDFFRIDTFIDSTHLKHKSPLK